MKMENNILADRDGTVSEIKITQGQSVLEGTDLIIIE
jgi:biotin carboxyl carrier protein